MTAQLLLGHQIAQPLLTKVASAIQQRHAQNLRAPALAVILIGTNPASQIYVTNKKAACQKIGITTLSYELPEHTTHSELVALIDQLNQDNAVDGILVQLPLPQQIITSEIIERIHPNKDVDGFHPYNLGRLAQGRPNLQPCTPAGIMLMLEYTQINLAGKLATVVGRSNIVGLPTLLALCNADATVITCNSATKELAKHVSSADILIVATGNPELIKGHWIKPGCVVIDVGMNRRADGKLVGDVEFTSAAERAAWISPVPGGVGPMTIACLLHNTLTANLRREHYVELSK